MLEVANRTLAMIHAQTGLLRAFHGPHIYQQSVHAGDRLSSGEQLF